MYNYYIATWKNTQYKEWDTEESQWLFLKFVSQMKVIHIGVGRFRILRGPRFRILGGGGGKFPAGTWRRNDVDAT